MKQSRFSLAWPCPWDPGPFSHWPLRFLPFEPVFLWSQPRPHTPAPPVSLATQLPAEGSVISSASGVPLLRRCGQARREVQGLYQELKGSLMNPRQKSHLPLLPWTLDSYGV